MTELPDRLAIRDLHDAYADAVARRDATGWAACWAEDAVWTLMGATVTGRDAIVAVWVQAMAGFEAVSFVMVPTAITIAGDAGTGRTVTHEVLRETGGRCRVVGGLYEDRFVRGDGRWRYAARDYRIVAQYPGEGS